MGGQTFAAGSTIADQVLVVFEHAYSGGPGAPPTGLERKDPGGSWTDTGATVTTFSQGGVTYTRATYTWGPNDWKNQTVEFRGKYQTWVTTPPPPRWSDWSYSSSSSWTRQDMVVSNDNGVLLFDGSTAVSIPWTITHANDGSNPTFEVTITIYGVTGSTVRVADTTDDAALGSKSAGAGSWSWNGRNDDNQVVAAGVYPYKVRAEHQAYWQNCHDTDKSYRPAGGALQPTVDTFYCWTINPQASTMTGCVKYTLNRAAGSCQIKLYSGVAGQAPAQIGNTLTCTSLMAGTFYSPQYTVPVVLDANGQLVGTYYAVIFAQETAADGASNRDSAPKYALQRGLTTLTYLYADINIAGVSEADEVTVGGFVPWNNDDDNHNGTQDRNETGTFPLENDLVAIALSASTQDMTAKTATLAASAGGSKVKVWTAATKGTQITLPRAWNLVNEQLPGQLWVEGYDLSGSLRDIGLTLTLSGTLGQHSPSGVDEVKATVWDLETNDCPSGWVPDTTSSVSITGTLKPSGLTNPLLFRLMDPTHELGYCMNGGTETGWDLDIPDQAGFSITYQRLSAETTSPVNSATLQIASHDFGAWTNCWVETTILGKLKYSHVAGGTKQILTLPVDNDGNYIADCWTYNTGNYADDGDTSLDNEHYGDGLTRYEEYRGVDINHDGSVSASERLNPNQKDLFVQGSGFGGAFPSFAYGGAFAECQIAVHDFVGAVGTDDRSIDVMVVTAPDNGWHLERRGPPFGNGVRDWNWGLLGESLIGGANAYGTPNIYRRSVNYYFDDRPHSDENTWTGLGVWGGAANGVLDPVVPVRVEDTNDDGVLDANERDGATTAPTDDGDGSFDGDYPVKSGGTWDWGQELSPMDIDHDGKVELPWKAQVPVPDADEYTKAQVVMLVITHEMGHATGIWTWPEGHCGDQTCLMYYVSNNWSWSRAGHLCDSCRSKILIHNN